MTDLYRLVTAESNTTGQLMALLLIIVLAISAAVTRQNREYELTLASLIGAVAAGWCFTDISNTLRDQLLPYLMLLMFIVVTAITVWAGVKGQYGYSQLHILAWGAIIAALCGMLSASMANNVNRSLFGLASPLNMLSVAMLVGGLVLLVGLTLTGQNLRTRARSHA